MDWTNPIVNESVEEREVEMSSLAAGFVAWMRKQAARAQEETTPSSEGLDEKCFKQSDPAKGVQISLTTISVDSLK